MWLAWLPRFAPSTSISSTKITALGFFSRRAVSRALRNISRTRWAPTPAYISTNSEPLAARKTEPVWCAAAFASSVFPVPGGPVSRTPFSGRMPIRLICSRFVMNSIASRSSFLAEFWPPMSSNLMPGTAADEAAVTFLFAPMLRRLDVWVSMISRPATKIMGMIL